MQNRCIRRSCRTCRGWHTHSACRDADIVLLQVSLRQVPLGRQVVRGSWWICCVHAAQKKTPRERGSKREEKREEVESGRQAMQDSFELGSSRTQFGHFGFGVVTKPYFIQCHIDATDFDQNIVMHGDRVHPEVT